MIFAYQSTNFSSPSIIALVATRHPSDSSTLRSNGNDYEFLLSRLFCVRTVIIGQRNIRASSSSWSTRPYECALHHHTIWNKGKREDFNAQFEFVKLDWTELTTNSRRPSIVTGCSYSTLCTTLIRFALDRLGKSLRERIREVFDLPLQMTILSTRRIFTPCEFLTRIANAFSKNLHLSSHHFSTTLLQA